MRAVGSYVARGCGTCGWRPCLSHRGDLRLRRLLDGQSLAQGGHDLVGDVGVGAQEIAHVLAALTETLFTVGEPGPLLVDDGRVDAGVQHAPEVGDALV